MARKSKRLSWTQLSRDIQRSSGKTDRFDGKTLAFEAPSPLPAVKDAQAVGKYTALDRLKIEAAKRKAEKATPREVRERPEVMTYRYNLKEALADNAAQKSKASKPDAAEQALMAVIRKIRSMK